MNIYYPKMTAARNDALNGIPQPEQEEELAKFADIFKLEPFRRALAEVNPSVWFTSLRQEQIKIVQLWIFLIWTQMACSK